MPLGYVDNRFQLCFIRFIELTVGLQGKQWLADKEKVESQDLGFTARGLECSIEQQGCSYL